MLWQVHEVKVLRWINVLMKRSGFGAKTCKMKMLLNLIQSSHAPHVVVRWNEKLIFVYLTSISMLPFAKCKICFERSLICIMHSYVRLCS